MGLPVLLLTAAPLLFLNLYYPLLEPDENRNAQIALEMFQSGDYVVPTRIGDPYLYKPPLLFWLISASYGLFGVNEWAARLPIALAALFTVAMTYWLGRVTTICLAGAYCC
jgi:4-amino-4-deoxy-L-arabinose transferase-like glycosyltransferase